MLPIAASGCQLSALHQIHCIILNLALLLYVVIHVYGQLVTCTGESSMYCIAQYAQRPLVECAALHFSIPLIKPMCLSCRLPLEVDTAWSHALTILYMLWD